MMLAMKLLVSLAGVLAIGRLVGWSYEKFMTIYDREDD